MAAELPHVLSKVASLGLAETYDELGRLNAPDQSLFPSSAEEKPADSGFLPWGPGTEILNAESDEKEVFVAPEALLTAHSNTVAIDTRRQAHREDAMDLFPDKIQPLNLLDLSIDILRDVVDYFREDWNDPKPQRLAPVRILAELPPAAREAGAALREIHIGCFPLASNFHLLAPGVESGWGWEDLRAACRELEVFTFAQSGNLNNLPIRRARPTDAQKAYIDRFFAAMLESSPRLEFVQFVLRPLGMNSGGGTQRDDGWYRFDGALRPSVEWRRPRHFTFMYVELHQEDLDIVCGALGENLDWVYLCHVWLMSGSWAGALDALHDKVSERARRGLCKVILTSLRGAEFEVGGGTGLVKLAESYLKGTIEENPLRKSVDGKPAWLA